MKKKSQDYGSPNSGGWINACTDIFLAHYRGSPCEISGKRGNYENGSWKRSAGHHLIFQSQSRAHKFSHENIIVLSPYYHSQFNKWMSPHSIVSTGAQERFASWVKENKPEQYSWWKKHEKDEFDKFASPSAREMYVTLGGEISDEPLMKDLRPVRHRKSIIKTIARECGLEALTKQELKEYQTMVKKGEA